MPDLFPGAGTSQEGMNANAQILGEMTHVTTMLSFAMKYTRAVLMLPRLVLSVAGTATRVCALLDACEQIEAERNVCPCFRDTADPPASSSDQPAVFLETSRDFNRNTVEVQLHCPCVLHFCGV
jgi:hypothetical protein